MYPFCGIRKPTVLTPGLNVAGKLSLLRSNNNVTGPGKKLFNKEFDTVTFANLKKIFFYNIFFYLNVIFNLQKKN